MELRVLPLQSGNSSTGVQVKTAFHDVFLENFFFGKVVGFVKESGHYLLYYKGQTVEVKSDNHLHLNEFLHLKTTKTEKGFNLEILERSFEERDTGEPVFSKNSIKSLHTLNEILEPYTFKAKELDESNFLKILQAFFPEIEWKDDTPWFEWKFGDSQAEGYFGKKQHKKTFYFQIFSSYLGRMVFLLSWEKPDMTDLVIQSFFSEERTYLMAFLKREKIFQTLKNSGIPYQNFSFTFSESHLLESENSEWIA